MELANLRNSGDSGLDGTSRDGVRLDGTSGGEGDSGVRMGAANSNGSAMSSSAEPSAVGLAISSAGGLALATSGRPALAANGGGLALAANSGEQWRVW